MLFEALALLGALWILYKFVFDPYQYWESKGFPFLPGSFPIGTKPSLVMGEGYQGLTVKEYYNKLSPHPYGGFYIGRKPHLILREPEIIQQILVKDFSHFRSRFGNFSSKEDPLSNHLFNLEGDRWKSVRVKLTPTFTSGKLKIMFNLFEACAKQLGEVLEKNVNKEIDFKDVMACFTTDIIASCAFGLECNSMNDPDNAFRKVGKDLFIPFIKPSVKFFLMFREIFPVLNKLVDIQRWLKFDRGLADEFIPKVIKDTIEYREANNVKRNDFLNLLMEMKAKGLQKSDEKDVKDIEMDFDMITAQCFVFFAAGFETSSSVQTYALYELALNQDIQEKLQNEIDSVLAEHNGKPTYEALQQMPYLEQIILETMRKYPTVPDITRECTKDYKTPEGRTIEKGIRIHIPLYALHHNEQYFPNPEKFDPDRFSPENKSSIPQYAYMPFGEGPRICIGMRFGLLQTKLGLVTTLSKFKVSPTAKTERPLTFSKTFIITQTKGPIIFKLSKRD